MFDIIKHLPEAILIIALFYLISLVIEKVLKQVNFHFDADTSSVFRLLSNSQKALLLVIALIMAIDKLGFDVSALVAGLGLSGFAVGFAMKDAISNFVAGIMIVIYKPCKIGDIIEIAGTKGEIVDINLRYLTIRSEKNNCLVPNSLILNNKVTIENSDINQ